MKNTKSVSRSCRHVHTALSLDERDAINSAKGRIGRLSALAAFTLQQEGDSVEDDEALRLGLADLFDIICDDLQVIDGAFALADARRGNDGGAR